MLDARSEPGRAKIIDNELVFVASRVAPTRDRLILGIARRVEIGARRVPHSFENNSQ